MVIMMYSIDFLGSIFAYISLAGSESASGSPFRQDEQNALRGYEMIHYRSHYRGFFRNRMYC